MDRIAPKFWQSIKWVLSPLRMIPSGLGPSHRQRSLQLCETLSLGEKRFIAVVQVGTQQFLVGGAGNSVSLLTDLPSPAGNESLVAISTEQGF